MIAKMAEAVIAGNITEAVSTTDSVISTAITAPVNALVFGRVDPGAEHGPVVAEHEQEHRGGGQQHAREDLHALGDQPERGAGE